MMKREKTLKIALSGALLLAVTAAGITMYRGETKEKQQEPQAEEQLAMEEPSSGLSEGQADAMESAEEEPEAADVTVNEAQAENTQELESGEQTSDSTEENQETAEEVPEPQTEPVPETEDTAAPVQPELNFSEDSSILWPVSGQVTIDYSMDATTYFSTLDQYKCNSALVMSAEVGAPVQAAANGKVVSVLENEETGTTATLDMGNGYQAVYGQLKDVTVEEGQVVESGTVLGYVNEPTKYYVKEGSNLYFAMTKDGTPIDPMIYMETVTEQKTLHKIYQKDQKSTEQKIRNRKK